MRKLPLSLVALALTALSAPPAAAQSFSGFLRGLSNSLSGGNQSAPTQNSGATATIGIRGHDEDNVKAGPARPEDLKLIDSWSATQVGAESAARKRGLNANQAVSYAGAMSPTTNTATEHHTEELP